MKIYCAMVTELGFLAMISLPSEFGFLRVQRCFAGIAGAGIKV
jgi:hypothetical protein